MNVHDFVVDVVVRVVVLVVVLVVVVMAVEGVLVLVVRAAPGLVRRRSRPPPQADAREEATQVLAEVQGVEAAGVPFGSGMAGVAEDQRRLERHRVRLPERLSDGGVIIKLRDLNHKTKYKI